MDSRLFRAAQLGNVESLLALLEEDALILEKSALAPTAETPLHIAAIAGKADFVREIIIQKPSFAWKLNQEGLSPLHIAAAIGYEDVVQELLSFGKRDDVDTHTYNENSSRLCMLKDKQGLIPLHYAAMKGEVTVIEELVWRCPESLKELTTRGQTVLHLAVRNSQFEAFKTLVDKFKGDDVKNFVDAEDNDGNQIYQMAVASKQLQVLEYLKGHSLEIVSCDQPEEATDETPRTMPPEQITKKGDDDISKFASEVVATLIATVTYQALLSPPATLPKYDTDLGQNCTFTRLFSPKYNKQCPQTSRIFYGFMIFNTIGFFAAVSLLLFRKVRLARILMPIALISMTGNYIYLSAVMTPKIARTPIYVMTFVPFTLFLVSSLYFQYKTICLAFSKLTMKKAGNEKYRRMAK